MAATKLKFQEQDQNCASCDSVCELCRVNFLCERLKAAMNLTEKFMETTPVPSRRLEAMGYTLQQIKESGFDYRKGKVQCELHSDKSKIISLTNRLISLLENDGS